jgi:hypothetical protein
MFRLDALYEVNEEDPTKNRSPNRRSVRVTVFGITCPRPSYMLDDIVSLICYRPDKESSIRPVAWRERSSGAAGFIRLLRAIPTFHYQHDDISYADTASQKLLLPDLEPHFCCRKLLRNPTQSNTRRSEHLLSPPSVPLEIVR